MQQGHWHEGTYRLCGRCSKSKQRDENECSLCNKVYFGEFVMCDSCEQWHCQPCSGFSDKQISNIEAQIYNCRPCHTLGKIKL